MKKLNSFFCCGLSTAGLVFGYLGLIGSIVCLITFSAVLCQVDDLFVHYPPQESEDPASNLHSISREMIKSIAEITCGVLIAIAAVEAVTSLCLIIGTAKKIHCLIIPWLTKQAIGIICVAIYVVFLFVLLFSAKFEIAPILVAIILVSGGLVFSSFAWLAIYSLHARIKESNKQKNAVGYEEGSFTTITHKRF